MDYNVVNNCLCSIEAGCRALKFEVSASKAEESPSTDVKLLKAEILPLCESGIRYCNANGLGSVKPIFQQIEAKLSAV